MSSNINPYNINGLYPVAGQDNSSQGFRDNFTNIKNNFIYAQSEISDLQSKAILTSALNGQTINNDMAGTTITRPQLKAWTQSLLDLGTVSSSVTLDFRSANFQKITTAGSANIDFSNWPSSSGTNALGYGLLRLWVVVTDAEHTLTLPDSVTIGITDIAGAITLEDGSTVITFDTPGNYVFDFSSIDGGQNYLIFDVVRNRSSFRDPSFYFNSEVNPTLLVGYGPGSINTAIALESGFDAISAHGSYNSVSIGDISINNIFQNVSGSLVPGYSVTSTRGNIDLGEISPAESNDFLGYFNAITFSGNTHAPGGNYFAQVSSIGFYATGTDTVNGLGGNVAIYTTPDGASGATTYGGGMVQAIGIENDQSTILYGTLNTRAGMIEGGTYVQQFATVGGTTFTANSSVSTLIMDSALSAAVSNATVILPANPVDRQVFKISAVAPITSSNIYAPGGESVKWAKSNVFSSGNLTLKLTYMSSVSTWYRS